MAYRLPRKVKKRRAKTPTAAPTPDLTATADRGWLGSRSVAFWTVIAGVAAIIAIPLGFLWPSSSPSGPVEVIQSDSAPSLRVATFAVRDPATVDATAVNGDLSNKPYQTTVKSNTIDVTLRNTGQQPALLTQLQGKVVFAKELDDCEPIGDGVRATANYTMTVPENPTAVPFLITRSIDFRVAPNGIDRLTVTIGPAQQYLSSRIAWIYVVDMSAMQDGSGSPIRLGTAAFIARAGVGTEIAQEDTSDWDCIDHNTKIIDQAYALPAQRSAEFDDVHSRYDAIDSTTGPTTASLTCAVQADGSSGITSACYRYTKRQMLAQFVLTTPAVPEKTAIIMHFKPTAGHSLTWGTWFRGDQWSVGFLDVDDLGPNGCGPCTQSGDAKHVTITYDLPPSITAAKFSVTVELVDMTDPDHPTVVSSMPKAVAVVRGD